MISKKIVHRLVSGYLNVVFIYAASSNDFVLETGEGPHFAEPIPNMTVAAGRSLVMPCVIENLQSFEVAWIHTDRHALLSVQDRVITRNHRYSISHNRHRTWWLRISNVEETDRGEYMCQINTSPMMSQKGYLNVVVPPKIDENVTSSDTDAREGSNVYLTCRATGSPKPTVKWRREDEKDIIDGNGLGSSAVEGEFLNISKVSRLHMGAYLCIASNGVQPSVSKRIVLNVNFAPMIWIPNQLIGAPVGSDVVLDCNLEGHPTSVTYWTKDQSVMIISNSKYDSLLLTSGLYKTQMRLHIKDIVPSDYGVYTCVAKNSLGETEGTIKLYEIPHQASSSSSHFVFKDKKTQITKGVEDSTELWEKDYIIGVAASALDHGFRKQGTEKGNVVIKDSASTASSQRQRVIFRLCQLIVVVFLSISKQ